ncbi:MAG: translation initiation factor eIF-2B [Haloferacaceae archaeon]
MIDETIEEIREMQTHSSSVVAVKATRALAELTEREYASVEEYEMDLERNARALRRANPSHASLYSAMRTVIDTVTGQVDSVEAAKELTRETIADVVEAVDRGKHRAAENLAETLDDDTAFLTHDYSTTVLEGIETAATDGRHLTAYVTEARPRYLGRKTVRTLAEIDRVEPHLLVDSAAGHLLDEVDRLILGMTCVVDDTYYNRVGSFQMIAAASELGVPVTVVGSSAKLIDEGFVFENEERPPSEVMLEPAEGFEVENPAYDATPLSLVDEIVTDEGVQRP